MTAARVITGICDMKTALVTGDLGFIGQHLCRALRGEGYHVIGLDLQRGGHEDIRLCPLPPADVCFHLAAQTRAQTTDAIEDASMNIGATLRILDHYRDKVVFAAAWPATNPVTPYAISKHACEHYCSLYGARLVRLCNITGIGGRGVIEAFAKADVLKIAGDGSQKRTYASVERAVAAFIQAADAPPGTLDILEGTELTVLEIAELFFPTKRREFVEQHANDAADVTWRA
jgi:nucleoside-diphosphate-sugar epimerase